MKKVIVTTTKKKKNIIIILLCFIALILGIVAYIKFISDKPYYVVVRVKGGPGNWWWVTPRPPDWLVSSIHVGDKEYSSFNKPTAEVLGLSVYDAGGPTKDIYMYVRLAAKKNKQTGQFRYKGETLQIGGAIILNLNMILVPGIVVELHEGSTIPMKKYSWKKVVVRLYEKWPWEYDSIKIGEKMDDGTDTVAEIMDKTAVPSIREPITDTGRMNEWHSPVKQDFLVTLLIRTEEKGSDLIFREEQYIKPSNAIWAQFPSYNISNAQILSINDF